MKQKFILKTLFLFTLFNIFNSSCCSFINAIDLGNNYVLSEYDSVDRRILYTEDKCSGNGIEVVPMTVIEYANDSNWIIAKSKKRFEEKVDYWIIDKNIKNTERNAKMKLNIAGPLDYSTYKSKIDTLGIHLILKKI